MLFLDGLSLLLFSAGLFLLQLAVAIVRHLASLLLAFLSRQRSKRLPFLHNNFESSSKLQFLYVDKCTVFHWYSFYQFGCLIVGHSNPMNQRIIVILITTLCIVHLFIYINRHLSEPSKEVRFLFPINLITSTLVGRIYSC